MLVHQADADREPVAQVQRGRQREVDDLHVRIDRVVAAGPGVVVFGLQAERRADHGAEGDVFELAAERRSEEHTSELQSLMRISYAVFCLKKKKNNTRQASPQKTRTQI